MFDDVYVMEDEFDGLPIEERRIARLAVARLENRKVSQMCPCCGSYRYNVMIGARRAAGDSCLWPYFDWSCHSCGYVERR
jgi:hypothetical protein